ncbi:hypothetical protein D3C72_1593600 [compost metagenome]
MDILLFLPIAFLAKVVIAVLVTYVVVNVIATVIDYSSQYGTSSSSSSKSNTSKDTNTNTSNKTGTSSTSSRTNNKTGTTNKTPNVPLPAPPTTKYPTDVNKPPAPGFEWKGKGTTEDGKGNWFNPKTGESLRPDLNHPKPIPPHWDYQPGRQQPGYRWFPDGSIQPK